MSQPDADARRDPADVVLDPSGGVPAVAVGTAEEKAQEQPATIRDSAGEDVPAVAAGSSEAEEAPPGPEAPTSERRGE